VDSLGAVELRNAVAARFSVALPATAIFDYPTSAALAAFVATLVAPTPRTFTAALPTAVAHSSEAGIAITAMSSRFPGDNNLGEQLERRFVIGAIRDHLAWIVKMPVGRSGWG
jgi:hypothetical protein